jgi:hypothetical protein
MKIELVALNGMILHNVEVWSRLTSYCLQRQSVEEGSRMGQIKSTFVPLPPNAYSGNRGSSVPAQTPARLEGIPG